ncbi:DNA/RNA non-specific endonuclease, partial [Athelia psychrophila]
GPIVDALIRKAYTAGYDRRLRHPAWTAEHLTLASLRKSPGDGGDRGKSTFREDEELPVAFRAKLSDYFRSGYDRGHMVPAADAKASQDAMDETFLLSNMAPQVGAGFNRSAVEQGSLVEHPASMTTIPHVETSPAILHLVEGGRWLLSSADGTVTAYDLDNPNTTGKLIIPKYAGTPILGQLTTNLSVDVLADTSTLTFNMAIMEAVERAAGLTLFSDAIKNSTKHICQTASCEVLVRRFDDAQKKAISAPRA